MKRRNLARIPAALGAFVFLCLPACTNTEQTTTVGVSVATVVKTLGLVDTEHSCDEVGGSFAPDIQAWWNGLSPTEKKFPFVGYEAWRNSAFDCTTSRVDIYHALFTFNMASATSLKQSVVHEIDPVDP